MTRIPIGGSNLNPNPNPYPYRNRNPIRPVLTTWGGLASLAVESVPGDDWPDCASAQGDLGLRWVRPLKVHLLTLLLNCMIVSES